MPLVVLALYDGFCYSIRPAQLVTCVVMLCFVIFLTMVWMGYMIAGRENPVEEQLLYLRVDRKILYYMGKGFFLLAVQLIFSMVTMAIPMMLALLETDMFFGPITAGDLVQSFLLLSGSAGAGIALGSLLSPQVMRDRRLSLLLTVFLAFVSVLGAVLKKYAVTAWFVWLLPSVSAIGKPTATAIPSSRKEPLLSGGCWLYTAQPIWQFRPVSAICADFDKLQLRVDKKTGKCTARLVVVNRMFC